jgi:phosphoenolpyruvate phosphomutase
MNKLINLIDEGRSIFVPGIFDGLTALLVEKKKFEVAWVSGFSVSSSMGLPDSNNISADSYINRVKEIRKVSTISLIVDCDEGFGNNETMLYLIESLVNNGVEAVCVEDNLFPKINSFKTIAETRRIECKVEFSKKIKLIKERFPDLIFIARTEAIVAGLGLEEAIERGRIYAEAGADVILLHSTYHHLKEFSHLINQWNSSIPLAVVPTNAKEGSFSDFEALGFRIVIYANQMLRASIYSMEKVLTSFAQDQPSGLLSDHSVSMDYIFNLTEKNLTNSIYERAGFTK